MNSIDTKSLEKWGVFICYRQTDGKDAAQWLHENLHDCALPVIPVGHSVAPRVDVYFDQTAPAVEDWTKIHQPALQRAKAFLMVCSPGATHKEEQEEQQDWVHRELEWWIENRDTAPIIIDPTGEGARWIPVEIKKRWPNAQQVLVQPKEWENATNKERENNERNTFTRLIDGICSSERQVYYEDLEREKKHSKQLEIQRFGLGLLVIIAVTLGSFGWWAQLEATKARDFAQKSEEQAKKEQKLAQQSLKKAQIIQSRFLADLAHQKIETGDPVTGLLLALEALPDKKSTSKAHRNRPYLSAAELRLNDALQVKREISVFRGHQDKVMSVAITPDGNRIVTGSKDGTARIWDTSSSTEIAVLRGHNNVVTSVAITPNGGRIVTGSRYGAARIWNGNEIGVLGNNDWLFVVSVAVTADGKRIIEYDLDI